MCTPIDYVGFHKQISQFNSTTTTQKKWDDDVALCAEAVRQLNRLKPKFAIVCGDLVHHLPSLYPDTDPEIRTRQVRTPRPQMVHLIT